MFSRTNKLPNLEEIVRREEYLSNVSIEENLSNSAFIRPTRIHFQRQGLNLSWDMALEKDSVYVIIYHKDRRQLICVRQFRPPVFVRRAMALPENEKKTITEVDFELYPTALGTTLELCAGIMDKPLSPIETVKEEILEECGFEVDVKSIEFVHSSVNVGTSGAKQHLFYVEVVEEQRVTGGGGNLHEGEIIELEYLDIKNLEQRIAKVDNAPPLFHYAMLWFMQNKRSRLL